MYIKNATYKEVPTAGLTFPLAEGSVITVGGVTGIVEQNVAAAGPTAQIYIAVGGTIDLRSEANKGVSFTDEQVKALGSDFNFIPAKEIADPVEIPSYSAADSGKVLTVETKGTSAELKWKDLTIEETGTLDGDTLSSSLTGAKVVDAFNTLTPIKFNDTIYYPQQKSGYDFPYAYYFVSTVANLDEGVFVFQLSYMVNDSMQISEAYLDELQIGG